VIRHKPGKDQKFADALSRLPTERLDSTPLDEDIPVLAVEHGSAIPFVCTYPVQHWDSILGTYLCTCCMFCTCMYLIYWSRSGHSLLG